MFVPRHFAKSVPPFCKSRRLDLRFGTPALSACMYLCRRACEHDTGFEHSAASSQSNYFKSSSSCLCTMAHQIVAADTLQEAPKLLSMTHKHL
ncbi:unnamed protein product [Protopolystoma xenopodis]|uniref:Uncharacterized protein n=1 Tax=Protopolystoma xenopodis TaxID=117903 RepID=A0A448XJ71_9PLAT|nr:unnamed protein product [Protopolystoma xenopodis]